MKKSLLTKTFLFLAFLIWANVGWGQVLLNENFSYGASAGNLTSLTTNWTGFSGTAQVGYSTSSLSMASYASTSINGSATYTTSNSEDIYTSFTAQSTGTFYTSFLLQASNTSTSGGYFIILGNGTNFGPRLFCKQGKSGSGNIVFGIGMSSTPVYGTTEFDDTQTYLVVIKYDFVDGATNDVASVYILNATTNSVPGTPEATSTGATDQAQLNSFVIRQASGVGSGTIDGIRVAQTWQEAAGIDATAPSVTFDPTNGAIGVLPTADITISFDDYIRNTDNSTIDNANVGSLITLKETNASGTPVAFTATIDATNEIITVNPDADLTGNQDYYVAIADVEDVNDNLTAGSNITFTTIDPFAPSVSDVAITEVDPYYAGDTITVTWTSANVTNVKIEAWVPSSSTWEEMVASTDAADGTEEIIIPSDARYSTNYKVRVSYVSDALVNAESATFTIIAVTSNLAELHTMSANDIVKYIDTATVTYTRTSRNQKYIQDASGAVLIDDNTPAPGYITDTYVIGDGITNVEGKISFYNGLTQFVPFAITGQKVAGSVITPEVRTFGSLTTADQSKLVKVVNYTFDPAGTQYTTSNLFVSSKNYDISGLAIADFCYRTTFSEADYIGQTIPIYPITTVGLVGVYNTTVQLAARNLADFQSALDTIGSTVYTVDQGGLTITGMPYSTTLATFKSNITAAAGATWDVYDSDGTTPATVLDDTKKLIVVAADGITSSTYIITRNAALTDATVSSTEYSVDNGAGTITGVPNGTDLTTFKSNITPPPFGSFEVYQTGGSVVATDLQTGYILRGTAEDGSTTKDYTITVNATVMDADSYVEAPTTQIATATIAVVDGDETTEAFDVFSFDITDAGTADGEPTRVNQIVLFYGPNMTLDFENEIDSGYLVIDGTPVDLGGEPVFGADSVVFPIADGEIVVADGGSVNAVVKLILNTTVADGKVIQFFINADQHGFVAKATGSGFAADFGTDVVGNDITIDVVATELNFSTEPTNVYVDANIIPAVVVEAIDANGNVDTDYVTDITITATGATLVGTPVTVTPVAGIATFNALSFSDEGAGVTLTAASGTLTNAVSIAFDVTVEPEKELFFSEYVEGSSNNKALEIYNPTDSDVDLTPYIVKLGSNGGDWGNTLDLTGTLEAGEVYVIANSSATQEILDVADITSTVTYFNGDDALGLFKGDVLIDVIGKQGEDPGTAWDVAGVENATLDHTLFRKEGRVNGNTNWTSSAGVDAASSEWIVGPIDSIANLGRYGLRTGKKFITYSFPGLQTGPATIDNVNHTVDIEVALGTSVTALVAEFTISTDATIHIGATEQVSGVTANDFSSDVTYTITAEDGSTQDWVVTVTVATSQSSAKEVTSFTVEGIIGNATIQTGTATEGTISATVEYGTDITSLKPLFTISDLATIADTTAALDFTNPQTYVVTAEDASTKDWVVTIVEEAPTEVANIAALRALYTSNNENKYKITGEVTFTYATKPYFYIQDATAAILIYDHATYGVITTSYNIGDNVSNLVGTFATFGNNMQFELLEDPGTAVSSGNVINAQIVTIPDLASNYADYDAELIKLEEVTFSETGAFEAGKNYTLSNGTEQVAMRTNFSSADYIGTDISTEVLNVTALAGIYNGTVQVYPRSLSDMVVATGINNPDGIVSMNLFPNPSNGNFTLEMNTNKAGTFNVEIINIQGQVVYQRQITQDGYYREAIDISNNAKGVYYVRIIDGRNAKVSKLIIQ